jgi:methionyl-tRNA synthetase
VFRDVEEEGGDEHTILTGDYSSWVGDWRPSDLPPGQKLNEPEALFRKLDPGIVDEELRRLEAA